MNASRTERNLHSIFLADEQSAGQLDPANGSFILTEIDLQRRMPASGPVLQKPQKSPKVTAEGGGKNKEKGEQKVSEVKSFLSAADVPPCKLPEPESNAAARSLPAPPSLNLQPLTR